MGKHANQIATTAEVANEYYKGTGNSKAIIASQLKDPFPFGAKIKDGKTYANNQCVKWEDIEAAYGYLIIQVTGNTQFKISSIKTPSGEIIDMDIPWSIVRLDYEDLSTGLYEVTLKSGTTTITRYFNLYQSQLDTLASGDDVIETITLNYGYCIEVTAHRSIATIEDTVYVDIEVTSTSGRTATVSTSRTGHGVSTLLFESKYDGLYTTFGGSAIKVTKLSFSSDKGYSFATPSLTDNLIYPKLTSQSGDYTLGGSVEITN